MKLKPISFLFFYMLLAPLLGGIGMLFGADKDTTSIICAFNGQGKIGNDAPVKEVKIEQKVAFNDLYVSDFTHHFISEYDYQETNVVNDGEKFGWLSFGSIVDDDTIRIFSQMNEKPKKSSISNVTNYWYSLDIIISRKTGTGVRNISYAFKLDDGTNYLHEYSVNGECKVRENKF